MNGYLMIDACYVIWPLLSIVDILHVVSLLVIVFCVVMGASLGWR